MAEGSSASVNVNAKVDANANANTGVIDEKSSPMEIDASPLPSSTAGEIINNNTKSKSDVNDDANASANADVDASPPIKLLHPDAYHRGLSKQEPRARNRGYLLRPGYKNNRHES